MRTIKFRGRDVCTGEYAYGDLIQSPYNGKIVFELREPHKRHITGFDYHTVDHDTVAQLVGYDSNGKEVYEGDTIVRDDGSETVVYYRDNPDYVHLHTLKEQPS